MVPPCVISSSRIELAILHRMLSRLEFLMQLDTVGMADPIGRGQLLCNIIHHQYPASNRKQGQLNLYKNRQVHSESFSVIRD